MPPFPKCEPNGGKNPKERKYSPSWSPHCLPAFRGTKHSLGTYVYWKKKKKKKVKVLVAQSRLPGFSVHGIILQARILEWVAFPFSRGSSQLRDQTRVSCIAGRFLTIWATREAEPPSKSLNCSTFSSCFVRYTHVCKLLMSIGRHTCVCIMQF